MPQYRNIPYNAACYSTVAVQGEQVLCVSVSEMVECGVSESVLKNAFSRQRTGGGIAGRTIRKGARYLYIMTDFLINTSSL